MTDAAPRARASALSIVESSEPGDHLDRASCLHLLSRSGIYAALSSADQTVHGHDAIGAVINMAALPKQRSRAAMRSSEVAKIRHTCKQHSEHTQPAEACSQLPPDIIRAGRFAYGKRSLTMTLTIANMAALTCNMQHQLRTCVAAAPLSLRRPLAAGLTTKLTRCNSRTSLQVVHAGGKKKLKKKFEDLSEVQRDLQPASLPERAQPLRHLQYC